MIVTVRTQFRQHLYTHADTVGFQAPDLLMEYLTDLLADRLDRVDIIPDPSFAERYLTLYHRPPREHAEFGDTALFFVSLMPEYGQRRGLTSDYYQSLGISAYYSAGDLMEDDRYIQLGNWFSHLQRFLNSAIRPGTGLELFDFGLGRLNTR